VPYVPNSDRDRDAMLRAVGVSSVEDLLAEIPEDLRFRGDLDVPGPLSELELERHMARLAALNRSLDDVLSFDGAGIYDQAIPAAVRHVCGMPQFSTAYTPYQAEASQGTLQAIYEYQTLIARLTGMDVANASMYDGATAAAEAVLMGFGVTRKRRVAVPRSVHPAVREVLATFVAASGAEVVDVPLAGGVTDVGALEDALEEGTVALVGHPNFFGLLEPVTGISQAVERKKAWLVASVDPLSLALLEPPGSYGAEVAVGEGQCLGSPAAYGGPLLGFMAARRRHIRRMPGRIIGATADTEGRRGYVMTLQTREQHIRREKATSNICTNQGLVALATTVYLSLLGKDGLRELASHVAARSHYAADALSRVDGVRLRFDGPFFREFVVELPVDAARVQSELRTAGIWPGVSLSRWFDDMPNSLLVAVSERHSREEIDTLASAIGAVTERRGAE